MDEKKPAGQGRATQDALPSFRRNLPAKQDVSTAILAQAPGSALDRFWRWLAYEPELAPGESLDLLAIRPSETVEIVAHVRHRLTPDVLGTARVIAADRREFKLDDGRVFDQRGGWPTFSERRSSICARRADR